MGELLEFAKSLGLGAPTVLALGGVWGLWRAVNVLWRRHIEEQDAIAAERLATADAMTKLAQAIREVTAARARETGELLRRLHPADDEDG